MKSEAKSSVKHTPWLVRTVTGYAGGSGSESNASVTLQIQTQSNTVEEVRQKVEALPELLEVCRDLAGRLAQVMENHPNLPDPYDSSEDSHEWTEGDKIALDNARNAITKATGGAL